MENKNFKQNILYIDIETAPSNGYYYDLHRENNIVWEKEDWWIMSFAYSQNNEPVKCISLRDFKTPKKGWNDDKKVVKKIHELLDWADIVVAHNGDNFDIKKINARIAVNKLKPPSPYKTIDTKKIAKKYFKFNSNSLNNLAKYLGIKGKNDTPKNMFKICIEEADPEMWQIMEEYNIQDVNVLIQVYDILKPWMTNSPIITETSHKCNKCESYNIIKRGPAHRNGRLNYAQRFQCKDCGGWGQYKL